jgi:hypothetical protein
MLLAGGPSAGAAVGSLASSLGVDPGRVRGADDWYYLRRRL